MLSGGQVSGGDGVGVWGEELQRCTMMGGARASVHALKKNKANSVNVPNKPMSPVFHYSFELIKSYFMATGFCFDSLHQIGELCETECCVFVLSVI